MTDDGTPILDMAIASDSREPRGGLGVVQRFSRANQILRWHAADIDAGAANGAVANERDVGTQLGRGDRGRKSRRARTDDREIVALAVVTCGATVAHDFVLLSSEWGSP